MTKKVSATNINIGISDQDRKHIAEGLSYVLADTYTLYLRPIISIGMSPARSLIHCTSCLKLNILSLLVRWMRLPSGFGP